ncbi:MAG: CDP-glycerol glycerophosphotransferase family protein [Deltaproteobacteria bacterium]|jgi:CDP-glycerol glycerophosphotransferase|nr:CDP-glycerol glycerophosphotransferase family protein [Deltaproteobacteria bacterium]
MTQPTEYRFEDLALLGRMSKRRDDLVVFLGRTDEGLMDNVKYAYLHACAGRYGFNAFFFTLCGHEHKVLEDAGLPAIRLDGRGVKILASAGVLVMDACSTRLPAEAYLLGHGAHTIQLWHGIPLKKVGLAEADSGIRMTPEKAAGLYNVYAAYKTVASTSAWATEQLFSKCFKADTFLELGYPRNDILLRAPEKNDLLNVDAACYDMVTRHRKSGGKVVVYMPTFRDTELDFTDEGGRVVLEPQELAAFTKTHGVLFLLKLHPNVDDDRLSALPGVVRYPSRRDIYPLLPLADALVTDYSSVYMDYLLLNRPIHFFAYDLQRYRTQDRELFFPYEAMTPGPIARTQRELLANLHACLVLGEDAHEAARLALREKLFTHVDACASQRICEHIRKLLRAPAQGAA